VVVILIWLFYRRDSFDIKKMILCTTLWTAIIIIRGTLQLLSGRIDFVSASWYTKVYLIIHFIVFISSIVLPVFLLFDSGRQIVAKVEKGLERIPSNILGIIFVLAAFWIFGFFWTMENSYFGVLAMRIGMLVVALTAGGMLFRLFSKRRKFNIGRNLSIGKTKYVILLMILLILYLVFALQIGTNNLDNINPDGLYYLNIAREYADGNPVIRGNWAPLLSWLIAPWISLGADPHKSYTWLIIIVGVVWILISTFMAARVGIRKAGQLTFAVAMSLIILSMGLTRTTPDLLGAVFVLLYMVWITHPEYKKHPIKYGLLAGITATLAYYSKSYNLPFIIAHLSLTVFLNFLHKRDLRPVIVGTVVSLLIIGICLTPWIHALYSRYGRITISTAGAIVYAKVGPGAEVGTCREKQLCVPASDVLLHGEDQQHQYFTSYGWSPFDNIESFGHQVRLIRDNIWNWINNILFTFGPLIPLALLSIGLGTLIFWRDSKKRFWYSWAILTILLYASGYMITFASQVRYYFAILPLLIMAGIFFLQRILDAAKGMISDSKTPVFNVFAGTVFVICFMSLGYLDQVKYLLTHEHDPCLRMGSEAIAAYLEEPMAGTDWQIYNIGYYTRTRTLGVIQPSLTMGEVNELLKKNDARTFVISKGFNIASELVESAGYTIRTEAQVCEKDYLVLRVP
jgi:4-amino-4-deoxy-L-arabinose transferase-like glycosyltransferase